MTLEHRKQSSIPDIKVRKDKWQRYVGAARISWGEINEDELLQLDGDTGKLAGLIHERYAVTRDEAELQVERFFAKNNF